MYQPNEDFEGVPDSAVAIVGMSCRFAGARDLDEYWTLLRGGAEGIQTFSSEELLAAGSDPALIKDPHYVPRGAPLADMEYFDASLFGLSPRDAAIMDPQHRHFLECSWEALENAGHAPQRFDGAIGVFAGSGHNAYMPYNLLTNPRLVRDVGLFLLRHTSNDKDFLTTRVSYLLDLKGPSINVQTACSTSLVAVHMAAQSLLNGECDMALAGGCSIELPHRKGYLFEEGEILSPDGHCRPFDAASQGTVFGSGVGVLVLRRLADAIESGDHIYAVIRGSAINNDGAGKVGYLAPSVDGQARVIAEALDIAGVDAGSISYVEAHGTGTPVGDPIEVAALTEAFRQTTSAVGHCGIGSVKGNIGHTDTAAGAASLIKVALALQHRELPASLNFTAPNPACAFDGSPFRVQADHAPWLSAGARPRRAGVSSLGVGGTNAHVVLEEAPQRAQSGPSREYQLLLSSAKSPAALDANAAALAQHISAHPEINLADAAYTLNVGRQAMTRRRIVVANGVQDAISSLQTAPTEPPSEALPDRPVAFLFCGAGAQHVDMARGLYEAEPLFRAVVDECFAHLDAMGCPDVRRWLLPTEPDRAQAAAEMERPSVALPALFAIQVALARFWMELGVVPRGMIGHSSGEYAAAHLAGVIDLAAGLRIVRARGRLFEQVARGGMLSIPLSEEELKPLLTPELSIAAINAPRLCVVSGPTDAIDRFQQALAAREIESQPVRISVAAHSAMLDPILAEFRTLMRSIDLKAPTLPMVSNLTGDWLSDAEATDPEYWVRHLRQTVRFTDGLQRLLTSSDRVLLEVGPGRSMASLARQHPDRPKDQPVLSSLRHPDQQIADQAFFLTTLGQLWTTGVSIDWDRFWQGEQRCRIPLPTYRFDRQRHWIDAGSVKALDDGDDMPPRRNGDIADWLYEPVWQRRPSAEAAPLDGPALIFEDDLGLGKAIAARLRDAGCAVVTVRAGHGYRSRGDGRFVVQPGSAADYDRLLSDLADRGGLPAHIYHCWLVTGPKPRRGQILELGFHSILALAPALARHIGETPVEIAIVSDRLQRVTTETGLLPEKATVLGPCRVAPSEYPNLHIRSVDILPPQDRDRRTLDLIAGMLIGEVASPCEAAPISYRANERWVSDFAARVPAVSSSALVRDGGVYLITGGLGGLGLTIAKHLAEKHAARLVLLTRTPLPPRARWAELLSAGEPIAAKLRKLLALEAAGAMVEIAVADVCNPRALRAALRTARARFGRIDGVFHAAGTLDDGLIETKTRESAHAVLAPKVSGTLALEYALRDHQPEFIMLFSSISAFAGLAGQSDYGGANAFLDVYAQSRRGDARTRVISVGWSQWRAVGMAAALDANALPDLDAGSPAEHPFFDRLHRISDGEFVVSASLSPDTHWLLDEHRVASGGALIPGTGYLEIARAAFATMVAGPIVLCDVDFLAPFAVADGAFRDLRVHLRRQDDGGWRFTILGRAAAAADAAWTEHATGAIHADVSERAAPIDIASIEAQCSARTPSPTPHLRFGPRWNNGKRVAIGRDEALLHLALPTRFVADLDQVALHPALLDIATAGAQQLIDGFVAERDFFAPLSYKRIAVHAPLPAAIISHVRLRPHGAQARVTAAFDVTITDEAGAVLAEISEFTMIRLRDTSLLSGGPVETATPAPSHSISGPSSQLQGIAPADGVQVIDRILTAGSAAHVVVSPYDLKRAIALLRAPRRAARKAVAAADGSAERLSAAEQTIADLWADLLGIDQIGRTDNFFDLGGHSLLAVQFTNRLRKQIGKTLPLAALLDTPTVERLALLIDPDGATNCPREEQPRGADAGSGLVSIRRSGQKPPVFFVHDGLGETLLYRSLANGLDAGHGVYGIEPLRSASGGYAHTRIDEMAADYVARLRQAQPDGPYLLAGLCAGGVIAFEMARQLQEAGALVAFVGIIDAADVHAAKRRFHKAQARLHRVRMLLDGFTLATLPVLARKALNAASWEITSRVEQVRRRRTVSRMRLAADGGDTAPAPEELPFLQLYEVAHQAHRPQGLFSGGDIVLFKASAGNGAIDDAPYREIYASDELGWSKRTADAVIVHDVLGGHTSVLQEPHVGQLAGLFQTAIDNALRNIDQQASRSISAADDAPPVTERHPVAAE